MSSEQLVPSTNIKNSFFYTLLDLIVCIILFLISQIIVGIAINFLGIDILTPSLSTTDLDADIARDIAKGSSIAVAYPTSMILAIALILGYLKIRGYKGFRIHLSYHGADPTIILNGFFWLMSAMVLLEPLTELLPESQQDIGTGMWACITAVVTAPILEEMLLRGIFLGALRTRYNDLIAVVLSSLLFGIMHFSPSIIVSAFFSGLVLGTIYIRTSSILSCIIIHSINNGIAYFLQSVGAREMTFRELCGNTTAYISLLIISAVVFILMCKYSWNTVFKPNFRENREKER